MAERLFDKVRLMRKVFVKSPVKFGVGARLKLSKSQVEDRIGCLEFSGKKDIYIVLKEVHFKAGEEIGIDESQNLPRFLEDVLHDPSAKRRDPDYGSNDPEIEDLTEEGLLSLRGDDGDSGNS